MARLNSDGSTRLFSPEGVQTARLMLYLLLSVVLMVMDQRGQYVPRIRSALEVGLEPFYHVAGFPARAIDAITKYSRSYLDLSAENDELAQSLLNQAGAVQQLRALEEENRRLRALLDATAGSGFQFRFAEMVQVNLDPYSHRVLIDRGADDGVEIGQAVLDGTGVMGQVDDVHAHYSSVLLLSDPDHALPVQLARTGLRTVAYGTGQTDYLELPNVPLHADVRAGDLLVTSGLGDRFPAGFPVAEVVSVDRDTGGSFGLVKARPLAALDKGREVLLVVPEPTAQAESSATDAPGEQDQALPEAAEETASDRGQDA